VIIFHKERLGGSMWVKILLHKYASQRPTERLLQSWQLLGLDLSAGTTADGLHRVTSPNDQRRSPSLAYPARILGRSFVEMALFGTKWQVSRHGSS
jgi:hypothetical protein